MESLYWLLVATIILVIFILLNYNYNGKNHPPGPRPWPIIGNFNLIGPLPHIALRNLSQKYGKLMYLKFGSVPVVVVSSPDMARQFLRTHDHIFASRPTTAAGKHTTYNYRAITWAPYGPYWSQARKIYLSELFSSKRLDSYEYIRVEERNIFLSRLHKMVGVPIVLKEQIAHSNLSYVKRMKAMFKRFDRFNEHVLQDHRARMNAEKDCFVAKDIVDSLLKLVDDPNLEVKLDSDCVKGLTQNMGTTQIEKTEQELRKEIEELHRQQWEITERLRDPRGVRRGGGLAGSRSGANRQRGLVRPADRNEEDQPAPKRRLSSTVVKMEEGEILEDDADASKGDEGNKDSSAEVTGLAGNGENQNDRKVSNWARRDGVHRASKMDFEGPPSENVPRVLPKDEDPKLVNRNRRMLGNLLGTLEIGDSWKLSNVTWKQCKSIDIGMQDMVSATVTKKFRKEDAKLSGSEAYMRRSDSLKRAEQRAREESERLRLQEREKIGEKRKQDLTLRARVAAKAEEKKLELLFLRWSEHHKKLGNFLRTKAEPPIYYSFAKQLEEEDPTLLEERKELAFQEWKAARREELSQYQKQITEQSVANADKELERWQNGRKTRIGNNDTLNLQETMDKELETHRLEHGPKTRKIPALFTSLGSVDQKIETVEIVLATSAEGGHSALSSHRASTGLMRRGVPIGRGTVPAFYQGAHSKKNVRVTVYIDHISLLQTDRDVLVQDITVNDRVEFRVMGDVNAKIRIIGITSPSVLVSLDCAIVISPSTQSLVSKKCGFDGLQVASEGVAFQQDWPYAVHLLAHLYLNDLNSARFLWKSVPAPIKESRPEVAAVWKIGQQLWTRNYAGVYDSIRGFNWSAEIQDFVAAFAGKFISFLSFLSKRYTGRMLELLMNAYSTISIQDTALFLGMNENDATNYVLQQGWSVDTASQMLTVKKQAVVTEQKIDPSKLQRLTEYVFHLEH
ncbi:Pinin/SDK/MemA protein [Artemisia annua]|uniref:Pinin/SDK/MemA protein n=1 Tax=Artemisia annua TaxID=35608 RepID=A0A2U1PJK8_ARTAN|nr:Pinin/SDK/MemA protein [Artemisia annua]